LSRLLTLKEIAQQLGVPESSLRKYREIFDSFIPSVGTGRSKRYREDAAGILSEIRHLREEMHMPWDAITDHLAKTYPMDAAPAGTPAAQPELLQTSLFSTPAQPAQQQPQAMQPTMQPVAYQQPAAPAPAQDGAYYKKILAMSEKQTMIVNALALELMRSVGKTRNESKREVAELEKKVSDLLGNLYHSMSVYSQHERAMLNDIKTRLDGMDKSLADFAGMADKSVNVVQVKEQVRMLSEKLTQREKAISDLKKNFDVLKRENAELREFKQRHIDRAEEHVREVKGMRHQTGIKRFLKLKP